MWNQSQSIFTSDSISQLLHHICRTKNLKSIKEIHGHVLTTSLFFTSLNIQIKLIISYTTCFQNNNFETLRSCFKSLNPQNPIPFNQILSDFCRKGFFLPALRTFSFMHSNGVPLDTYAFCSSLTASYILKDVNYGKQIHAHVRKSGWLSSVFVGSALVGWYGKVSLINDAAKVFDEIPMKNTVCANALLSGYSDAKLWVPSLELVRNMPALNLYYDRFTLSAILRACGGLPAIELGKQVHAYLFRNDYDMNDDVFLWSSMIEMYGRCGLVGKAWKVFSFSEPCSKRDVVLWTSILGVYGKNGYFEEVIELYQKMLNEGVRPDAIAFVTIISACGHTGQVELGLEYFESMTRDYNLDIGPEHYSCLVDLLCRAGELGKATKVINEMIDKGHHTNIVSMWGALLSACEDQGNVELGRLAAQNALKIDPHNVGVCVLLSKLYAKFGMWDEINRLRELIKEKRTQKDQGCSWIEVTANPNSSSKHCI